MGKMKKNYFNAIVGAFEGYTYVCSSENIIEYVNQRVIDKIGHDITGEYCFNALHGLDEVCPWCMEQPVFNEKNIQWEHKNPQSGRWYKYMASPVFHSDGTISKLTLCSDITENKMHEIALNESERRLKTLMANLPGMAYRCKADQNVTMEFASQGCYKLLGYAPSDLIGNKSTSFYRIVHPDDRDNLIRTVDKALMENRAYSFIYRIKKASGKIVWVWEQGEGVFSRTGKLVALEGFISNVTEYKQVELDLRKENIKLKSAIKDRYKFGNMVGKSEKIQKIYELIIKASANDAHVIIYGESGTGKELVAQSIHNLSDRKDKAFVAINCGAIHENLIESQFFGHKKGAFTGATADAVGYLEKAHGGTLFLDELGEMSLSMQIILLRALESRSYTPVGDNRVQLSDFRIIAATNRNLAEAVRNGDMREDFYYRIHILPISLPPLRERKEDIPLLVDHFMKIYPGKGTEKQHIPIDVKNRFQQHDWPGNVRELQNAVFRYLALGKMDYLAADDKSEDPLMETGFDNNIYTNGSKNSLFEIVAALEQKIILKALETNQWNRGKTAEYLNIDRKTLYRKIKSLPPKNG